MKTFALVLLCLTGFAGQQTAVPAGSADPNQRKARELVDQMIATLGGQAYLTVQDYEMEGRTGRFYHGTSEGGSLIHRYWQWPDKELFEFTKQRDIVSIYMGDKAFETTFRATRLLDPHKDQHLPRSIFRLPLPIELVLH